MTEDAIIPRLDSLTACLQRHGGVNARVLEVTLTRPAFDCVIEELSRLFKWIDVQRTRGYRDQWHVTLWVHGQEVDIVTRQPPPSPPHHD